MTTVGVADDAPKVGTEKLATYERNSSVLRPEVPFAPVNKDQGHSSRGIEVVFSRAAVLVGAGARPMKMYEFVGFAVLVHDVGLLGGW